MGSTFYLFYMVLFTGGLLWCLFLWLSRDEEDEKGEVGSDPDVGAPVAPALNGRARASEESPEEID